jgi:hypothetical protein
VIDDRGNVSTLSNSTFETTLGVPALSLSPDSLADTLHTGGISTVAIHLGNSGEGILDAWWDSLPGWLSVTPESLSLPAHVTGEAIVRFDARGL